MSSLREQFGGFTSNERDRLLASIGNKDRCREVLDQDWIVTLSRPKPKYEFFEFMPNIEDQRIGIFSLEYSGTVGDYIRTVIADLPVGTKFATRAQLNRAHEILSYTAITFFLKSDQIDTLFTVEQYNAIEAYLAFLPYERIEDLHGARMERTKKIHRGRYLVISR